MPSGPHAHHHHVTGAHFAHVLARSGFLPLPPMAPEVLFPEHVASTLETSLSAVIAYPGARRSWGPDSHFSCGLVATGELYS